MILKPRSLEEMEQLLNSIPRRKRKAIVITGRHPNEGSIAIANQHHKNWERQGTVTIQLPRHWTPHYLWTRIMRHNLSEKEAKELHDAIPDDYDISEFLYTRGFRVPVVHFHGTPNDERNRGLLLYVHPAIRKEEKLAPFSQTITVYESAKTLIPEHPDIVLPVLCDSFTHPIGVQVEFCFQGKSANKKLERTVKELNQRFSFVRPDLKPVYLQFGTIRKQDVRDFSVTYERRFERVLYHLAKTGLKGEKKSFLARLFS